MTEFDENGFEMPLPPAACEVGGRYPEIAHHGETFTRYSRSGMTSTLMCWDHWIHHNEILDGIAERYPDSSVAPAWFDPTYAGESWDSDY